MKEKKEFLTEENYERGKSKIKTIALAILIIGVLIGVTLISIGLIKQNKVNSNYSDESKAKIQEQLSEEKTKLEEKLTELEKNKSTDLEKEKTNILKSKSELEAKIKPIEDEIKSLERVPFSGFDDAYYAREDKIEDLKKSIEQDKKTIKIIEDALDENFDHCAFDDTKNNSLTSKYCSIKNNQTSDLQNINLIKEALDESYTSCAFKEVKNNSLTSKYCSLKEKLDDKTDFNKEFDSFSNLPFYVFGGAIIVVSCLIAGSIYMITKRREIMAFTVQQTMPLAQEGIEKMAPTIGKAGKTIVKDVVTGIKEAKAEPGKCPHCGGSTDNDSAFCKSCGKKL